MAVLLLISASLVADTAARWNSWRVRGFHYVYGTLYDNLVAGAVRWFSVVFFST